MNVFNLRRNRRNEATKRFIQRVNVIGAASLALSAGEPVADGGFSEGAGSVIMKFTAALNLKTALLQSI